MNLQQTLKDIRTLRIQGAENIAIAGCRALYNVYKTRPKTLTIAYKQLVTARKTEPALRTGLLRLMHAIRAGHATAGYKEVMTHYKSSRQQIARHIARLIKPRMIVYTHCHSSTIIEGLVLARKTKKFFVHNTETRPLFQGRKTARELAKAKIPVTHYVDSGMRLAIKNATVILLGADAITARGEVYNKIGSELAALVAQKYKKPVFICTDSWKFYPRSMKFDVSVEKRHSEEVWKKIKNIQISNYAFEKINYQLITGIITEFGMVRPRDFRQAVLAKYPWIKKI